MSLKAGYYWVNQQLSLLELETLCIHFSLQYFKNQEASIGSTTPHILGRTNDFSIQISRAQERLAIGQVRQEDPSGRIRCLSSFNQ